MMEVQSSSLFSRYASPLSRRIPTNWLDSLDVQWSASQILFLESISQSLEVIGLEVTVERSLIVIWHHYQYQWKANTSSCTYRSPLPRRQFFHPCFLQTIGTLTFKRLVGVLYVGIGILTASFSCFCTFLARSWRSSLIWTQGYQRRSKHFQPKHCLHEILFLELE